MRKADMPAYTSVSSSRGMLLWHRVNGMGMKTQLPQRTQSARAAWRMLTPSLLGVGLFMLLPLLAAIGLSMLKWNLIGAPHWIGVANYIALVSDPGTWNSLAVTAAFTLIAVPGTAGIGLLIALGLRRRMPGTRVLALLYVAPWAVAPMILGVIWQWILSPSGALNAALGTHTAWLSNPHTALPALALIYVWQNAGYVALFFLAGLAQIPNVIYDAAALDGAFGWRRFTAVTLPLLRPTTFFVLATSTISALQVFDLAYGLTGGTPGYPAGTTDLLATHIYSAAFTSPRIGQAAALAVLLSLLVLIVSALQWRYFRFRTAFELGVAE